MADDGVFHRMMTRRRLLAAAKAAAAGAALSRPAWAQSMIDLPLPGGPGARQITTSFPQKGKMILQRTRPPLLETPFEVFDRGVFTPNDMFYVRWHWAVIPTDVDVNTFRLSVAGHRTCAQWRSDDRLRHERRAAAALERLSAAPRGAWLVRDLLGEDARPH